MIRSFIFLFIILGLLVNRAYADEEVYLNSLDLNRLNIPNTTQKILDTEREYKEYIKKQQSTDYYDIDESVFESKAGRRFSDFVDKVIINNKLNRGINGFENSFLNDKKEY